MTRDSIFGDHICPSVVGLLLQSTIVHQRDSGRIVAIPSEDDSPLVVYPNRVVSFEIASQAFESITRRTQQIQEFVRSVDQVELPESLAN